MNSKVDLSIDFAGLSLANPIFTASGTCGYADELAEFFDINRLGGFVTKSITLNAQDGNPTPRIVETDSGMLNAIGLANIGVERFIEEKLPIIAGFSTPFFVNLAGKTIEDYVKTAELLVGKKELAGFELNISCPNVRQGGITFGTEPKLVSEITSQVKKTIEKKILIVKLTPNVTDISTTASAAIEAGADALSLVNTFTAMVIDIEKREPVLANRTGGLSGPAIKPIAVYMVNKIYNEVAKSAGVPLLAGGGIRTGSDAIEFMLAGATAVSVGTATFVQPDVPVRIIKGIEEYCLRHKITSVKEIIGSLK